MNPAITSIISGGVAIFGTLMVFFRWIRQNVSGPRQEMGTLCEEMGPLR